MTYLGFHFAFILPPLCVLAWLARSELGRPDWRPRLALLSLCLLAFCYTTPWDNYLVYRQIWGYGEGRVLATLFYVPLEEYLFFLLQTLLTGCLFLVWARPRHWRSDQAQAHSWSRGARLTGAFVFGLALLSWLLLLKTQTLYLGLILVWALPVLALQVALGGDQLWRRAPQIYLPVAFSTLYLWLGDAYAIGQGIWWIAPEYTLPWRLGGILPLEEMLFFLISNLMVCQGLGLFLDPVMWRRLQGWYDQARSRWPELVPVARTGKGS